MCDKGRPYGALVRRGPGAGAAWSAGEEEAARSACEESATLSMRWLIRADVTPWERRRSQGVRSVHEHNNIYLVVHPASLSPFFKAPLAIIHA